MAKFTRKNNPSKKRTSRPKQEGYIRPDYMPPLAGHHFAEPVVPAQVKRNTGRGKQ